MHYSTLSGAAALLALAPSALAAGSAHINNQCSFPVYYASVGQSVHANMEVLGGSYSEAYSKPGVGVSIKLSPSESGPVSQFEFTWADGKIYYDLSNIDGSPFADAGMTLVPSMMGDSANPTCQEVDCPAGEAVCHAAYNAPDDVRTTVCNENSDLTLTLCPGGSGTSGTTPSTSDSPSNSSSSDSSSPAETSYPAEASSPAETGSPTTYTPPTTTSKAAVTLTRPTWGRRYHARHMLTH